MKKTELRNTANNENNNVQIAQSYVNLSFISPVQHRVIVVDGDASPLF